MPDAKIYWPRIKDVNTIEGVGDSDTDAREKAYAVPRQAYVVTIFEDEPKNVRLRGVLNIDKRPA